jgi:hypothetical protein
MNSSSPDTRLIHAPPSPPPCNVQRLYNNDEKSNAGTCVIKGGWDNPACKWQNLRSNHRINPKIPIAAKLRPILPSTNLDSFALHKLPPLLTRSPSLHPCGLRGQGQLQHLSPVRRQAAQSSTLNPVAPPNHITNAAALLFKQHFCWNSDLLVSFLITIRHPSSHNCYSF